MEVKYLELLNEIECGTNEDNGNGILYICKSFVTNKDLEATKDLYISEYIKTNKRFETIPKGKYFFIQQFLQDDKNIFDEKSKPTELLYTAAESLWLEFIWQEKIAEDDIIYVRILNEDKAQVFQLFRKIKS